MVKKIICMIKFRLRIRQHTKINMAFFQKNSEQMGISSSARAFLFSIFTKSKNILLFSFQTRQKYFCPTLPERQIGQIKPNFGPFFNSTQNYLRPKVQIGTKLHLALSSSLLVI